MEVLNLVKMCVTLACMLASASAFPFYGSRGRRTRMFGSTSFGRSSYGGRPESVLFQIPGITSGRSSGSRRSRVAFTDPAAANGLFDVQASVRSRNSVNSRDYGFSESSYNRANEDFYGPRSSRGSTRNYQNQRNEQSRGYNEQSRGFNEQSKGFNEQSRGFNEQSRGFSEQSRGVSSGAAGNDHSDLFANLPANIEIGLYDQVSGEFMPAANTKEIASVGLEQRSAMDPLDISSAYGKSLSLQNSIPSGGREAGQSSAYSGLDQNQYSSMQLMAASRLGQGQLPGLSSQNKLSNMDSNQIPGMTQNQIGSEQGSQYGGLDQAALARYQQQQLQQYQASLGQVGGTSSSSYGAEAAEGRELPSGRDKNRDLYSQSQLTQGLTSNQIYATEASRPASSGQMLVGSRGAAGGASSMTSPLTAEQFSQLSTAQLRQLVGPGTDGAESPALPSLAPRLMTQQQQQQYLSPGEAEPTQRLATRQPGTPSMAAQQLGASSMATKQLGASGLAAQQLGSSSRVSQQQLEASSMAGSAQPQLAQLSDSVSG